MARALVTGGSGYFGSLLTRQLVKNGWTVRILDLNDDPSRPGDVEIALGDIRDIATVREACASCDVVFHNVAQVPLSGASPDLVSVNVKGTEVLLRACRQASVPKVVHTSSSAVFGIPAKNPVDDRVRPAPREAYGWAKFEGELLAKAAVDAGQDVTIIRPRTILGHGRLGIFSLLFDWIANGADAFVIGKGDNRYQFVHALDLADACIKAALREGPATYNIGASRFGTMREALESLVEHAQTGSRVRSLPRGLTEFAMRLSAGLRLTPFAPYHWIMYGQSMWFDIDRAREDLDWEPRWSNNEMLIESYDWYLGHGKGSIDNLRSEHRRPVAQGALKIAGALLRSRARA